MTVQDDPNYEFLNSVRINSPFSFVHDSDLHKRPDQQIARPWCDAILAMAAGRPFAAGAFGSASTPGSPAELAQFVGVTDRAIIHGEATVHFEAQGSATVKALPLSLVTGWKIDRFHGSVVSAQDLSDAFPSDCRLVVETSNGQKVTLDTSSAGDTNRPRFHWNDLVAVMGLLSK